MIEQIAGLERLKSAAAAGQARAAAALDERRRADEAAAGVPARQRGRGVASEVALARRDSPARGGRHLGLAKALVHEMPHTLAALECGALSEWRATGGYTSQLVRSGSPTTSGFRLSIRRPADAHLPFGLPPPTPRPGREAFHTHMRRRGALMRAPLPVDLVDQRPVPRSCRPEATSRCCWMY